MKKKSGKVLGRRTIITIEGYFSVPLRSIETPSFFTALFSLSSLFADHGGFLHQLTVPALVTLPRCDGCCPPLLGRGQASSRQGQMKRWKSPALARGSFKLEQTDSLFVSVTKVRHTQTDRHHRPRILCDQRGFRFDCIFLITNREAKEGFLHTLSLIHAVRLEIQVVMSDGKEPEAAGGQTSRMSPLQVGKTNASDSVNAYFE